VPHPFRSWRHIIHQSGPLNRCRIFSFVRWQRAVGSANCDWYPTSSHGGLGHQTKSRPLKCIAGGGFPAPGGCDAKLRWGPSCTSCAKVLCRVTGHHRGVTFARSSRGRPAYPVGRLSSSRFERCSLGWLSDPWKCRRHARVLCSGRRTLGTARY
jgi:hypothetical protein